MNKYFQDPFDFISLVLIGTVSVNLIQVTTLVPKYNTPIIQIILILTSFMAYYLAFLIMTIHYTEKSIPLIKNLIEKHPKIANKIPAIITTIITFFILYALIGMQDSVKVAGIAVFSILIAKIFN